MEQRRTWVSNHPDDENEDAYHVDPSANLSKLEQILQCDASPWSPSNFLLICFEQGSYFVERPLKIGFAKRPVQLMGHREPLLGSSESLRSDSRHTIIHAQLEAAERSRGILRHLRVLQRMESSIEPCVDIVGSRWAMDRCKVESLGGICVEVSGASQVALVSCSIGGVSYRTGHCQHGLWVSGTSHVQMRSCQVQFSSINGISLQEKARCSISQTALYKCTVGLSLLLPARARVASSTFMLNSHGAFYLGKRELNLTSNGCEMRPEALNMIDSYADQVPKGVARNLRSIFTLTKGEEQEQEQEQEQPRPHLRLENTQVHDVTFAPSFILFSPARRISPHPPAFLLNFLFLFLPQTSRASLTPAKVHGPLWSSTDPPPSSLYEVSGSLEAKDDGTRHAGIAFSRIPLGANNHGFPHSARIITSDCLSSSEVEETPRTEVPRATNESNSTAAPPTPQAPAAPRRAASLPDSEGFSSGIHDSESEGPKQEVRPRTKGAKLQELLGADNFIPIDEPFSVELDESFSIEED
ncbi:hypothetical protein GUITHDRAFT_113719 [Guillardia theta CCMP2712]|uniref:Right handed beta helix domain-containing protein n=1 Tax=Guillardia theta (strain CCMP2712) TaxID=905079 RepID=L1IVF9_GUITC|nr:hypothetical protein GUITHDRAFT_113719 [Guillardia theta CCMP2712]EKX40241.1 hypothetical protein GUITHDRAFT_113719 [Guillardia theta CCMP2712]|eukprot:XP_005827221.1 hypothetical protein GUITHDRAFT_113719 [Guillardia theta CCMP2712]